MERNRKIEATMRRADKVLQACSRRKIDVLKTLERAVSGGVTEWANLTAGGKKLGLKGAQTIVNFIRGVS